jgi:hypothetical protein
MLATVVDTDALLEAVAAAVVGGVGIAIAFSLGILGAVRWAEARRDGRSGAAGAAASLAVVALAASLGVVVTGIVLMASR